MSDETFQVGDFTVHIEQDDSPENPREWDHMGHMICWHGRYILGDMDRRKPRQGQPYFPTPQDFLEWVKKAKGTPDEPVVLLALGLLDHSGLHMYVGSGPHWTDPDGWDSGQVGWIYATRAEVMKEFNVKRVGKQTIAKATKYLEQEVAAYDRYLTGDIWMYWIEDEDGENVDSCCGFDGYDYWIEQAKEAAQSEIDRRAREDAKIDACLAL